MLRTVITAPRVTLPSGGPARSRSILGGLRSALMLWDFVVVLVFVQATGLVGTDVIGVVAGLLVAGIAVSVLVAGGSYARSAWLRPHPVRVARKLLVASTAAAWSMMLVASAVAHPPSAFLLMVGWLAVPFLWLAGRGMAALLGKARPERVVIVGTGAVARRVVNLTRRPRSSAFVIGCLENDATEMHPGDPPLLGSIDQLSEILATGEVDRVIVAFSRLRDQDILQVLRESVNFDCPVDIVPRFFEFVGPATTTYHAEGLAFQSVPARSFHRGAIAVKRAVDLIGSAMLLFVMSPVLGVIAIAILLDSGRPVLYRQPRAGLHGATFTMLKFRSLRPPSQPESYPAIDRELLPKDVARHHKEEARRRTTGVGAFLRKTSLDELPQLVNVLRGEMSLIGPRPLPLGEFALLRGWELQRQEMRPGLTGLWQVSGRSETSWEDRVYLDQAQVQHWSLSTDLEILADTLPAVWQQRGAL